MRHRKGNRKLNKATDQRIALLRNQSLNLFTHKKITTTLTRAQEVQKFSEKLITLTKNKTVHNIREALKVLPNKNVVSLLVNELSPKFKDRSGGYTRIVKLGYRKGDGAPLALLEFVD